MRKGGGNGGLWKARKTIVLCFPTFPQTLGAAKLAANPAVKHLPVELAQLPL
jgi:hypothetical protein